MPQLLSPIQAFKRNTRIASLPSADPNAGGQGLGTSLPPPRAAEPPRVTPDIKRSALPLPPLGGLQGLPAEFSDQLNVKPGGQLTLGTRTPSRPPTEEELRQAGTALGDVFTNAPPLPVTFDGVQGTFTGPNNTFVPNPIQPEGPPSSTGDYVISESGHRLPVSGRDTPITRIHNPFEEDGRGIPFELYSQMTDVVDYAIDQFGRGNRQPWQDIQTFAQTGLPGRSFEQYQENRELFGDDFLGGLASTYGPGVYTFSSTFLTDIQLLDEELERLQNPPEGEEIDSFAVTVNRTARNDAIREAFNQTETEEGLDEAGNLISGLIDDVEDFGNSIYDPETGEFVNPDVQADRELLERLASGEEGIVTNEQIQIAYDLALPEIDRFLAGQSARIGAELGASGVGRGTFAQSLSLQAANMGLSARIGLGKELQEFQLATNAQLRSHFIGLLTSERRADRAFQTYINDVTRGLTLILADLEQTPIGEKLDMGPYLTIIDAARNLAFERDFFDSQTGFDPLRDVFDIAGGIGFNALTTAGTGFVTNFLGAL